MVEAEDVITTDVVLVVAVEVLAREEIAEAVAVEDLDLIEDRLHHQEMVVSVEHHVVKADFRQIVIVPLADQNLLEELQKVHQIELQGDQMTDHQIAQEDLEKANTVMC